MSSATPFCSVPISVQGVSCCISLNKFLAPEVRHGDRESYPFASTDLSAEEVCELLGLFAVAFVLITIHTHVSKTLLTMISLESSHQTRTCPVEPIFLGSASLELLVPMFGVRSFNRRLCLGTRNGAAKAEDLGASVICMRRESHGRGRGPFISILSHRTAL